LQGIEFQQGRLHEKTDKIGLHPGRALGAVFRYAQVTGDDTHPPSAPMASIQSISDVLAANLARNGTA
jgi:hypothetical protein